jgi:hypothetical protein
MPQWLAIPIVVVVGGLLIYWHWTGTQIVAPRAARKGSVDGSGGGGWGILLLCR